MRRLLAAVAVTAYVLLAPATAHAADGAETTTSYDVTISVSREGVTHVSERIAYDFGIDHRHGIERFIPVVYDYPPKPGYDRILKIENLTVSSDAPHQVSTQTSGSNLLIRIGDPKNDNVTGQHVYVIDYDVLGALNRFDGHVQLDWNALGTQWAAPIQHSTVTVTFPSAVRSVVCFRGPQEASLPCTSATVKAGVVHVTQTNLAVDEGLTVSVAAPPDSVGLAAADPILRERWSFRKAFAVTPATVAGAGGIALLGLAGLAALVLGRGRDRRYVGEVPGLAPVSGIGTEEREPLFDRTPVAVEFAPPDGLRPGQVGTLLDERVDPLDVSATIVDLAVHGYLRIEEQEAAHRWSSKDWTLVQLSTDYSKLLPYEQLLLAKLFEGRNQVQVSALKKTFSKQLESVKSAMYADVVKQGFFRSSPQNVRILWGRIGAAVLVAGIAVTWLLAKSTHAGLVGVGVFVVGLGVLSVAHRMPARTAKGRAALVRTYGFRLYLGTAEANQLKFEEGQDIFSRYLPYAIVFHETEHWAKVFQSIGSVPGATGGPGIAPLLWYVGPPGWDFGSLGDSLGSFAASTGSAMAEAPVSSGSGGASFSGGGFGGGGGGSW